MGEIIGSITCEKCGRANPAITVLCTECANSMLRIMWWYYVVFFISLAFVGYSMEELKVQWVASIYAELLFFIFVLLLLRNYRQFWVTLSFYLFISFFLIFLQNYGYFEMKEFVQWHSVLKYLIVLYLPFAYGIMFLKTCREMNVSLIRAFPVFSFVLYSLIISLDELNIYYKLIDPRHMGYLTKHLYIREISLGVTAIFLIFIAFMDSIKRPITPLEDFFRSKTILPELNLGSRDRIIRFLKKLIRPFYVVLGRFYVMVINFGKDVINILKRGMDYMSQFLFNFASELRKLIGQSFSILLKSIRFYFTLNLIPLTIFFAVAYAIVVLVDNIHVFITTENTIIQLFFIFLIIFWILLGLLLMVWSMTEYGLKEIGNSVTLSSAGFLFTLFIGLLIASYVLWLFAKFRPSSLYKDLGIFTVSGSVLIFISFLVIYVRGRLLGKEEGGD